MPAVAQTVPGPGDTTVNRDPCPGEVKCGRQVIGECEGYTRVVVGTLKQTVGQGDRGNEGLWGELFR